MGLSMLYLIKCGPPFDLEVSLSHLEKLWTTRPEYKHAISYESVDPRITWRYHVITRKTVEPVVFGDLDIDMACLEKMDPIRPRHVITRKSVEPYPTKRWAGHLYGNYVQPPDLAISTSYLETVWTSTRHVDDYDISRKTVDPHPIKRWTCYI